MMKIRITRSGFRPSAVGGGSSSVKLGDEIRALDELSLIPVPIPGELLQREQYLFDLDDHALLQMAIFGVELHHLVRNVRSTMLTKQDYAKAANYWSQLNGDIARLVEMHHVLEFEETLKLY